MSRSGRNTYGRRRRGDSRFIILLDYIVLAVSVLLAVLLACAYLAKYINPSTSWFPAFCGLIAPILYILNILILLYWIIRWKIFLIVPLIVLIIGFGSISLFFRPSLSKHYDLPEGRASVVMSYNVMGFIDESRKKDKISSIDSLAVRIRELSPEVLCMQEFQAINADQKHRIDSLLGMPFDRHNYVIRNNSGGGWGLAIYSTYPIVSSGEVAFENSTNSAMWVDLLVGYDTIRVLNCHLQTTAVNASDKEYINNREFLIPGSEREERVRNILSKLKNNFAVRASQVDILVPMLRESPYKIIICGDFNDTPMSYAYHKMRGELNDTFVEKGRGLPNTYRYFYNLFRIDYILHSKEVEALSYSTPDWPYSDHKPVIAGLDF